MSKRPYPERPEIKLDEPDFVIWDRYQIVIPCYDKEQADRIAAKVADFCGGYVEHLFCTTNQRPEPVILSEAVAERSSFGCNAMTMPDEPAESEPETQE